MKISLSPLPHIFITIILLELILGATLIRAAKAWAGSNAGIIPALETAHALAVLKRIAKNYDEKTIIVMNMCGRGDKDIFTVADELQIKL